jgi:hypothetical protein
MSATAKVDYLIEFFENGEKCKKSDEVSLIFSP